MINSESVLIIDAIEMEKISTMHFREHFKVR